MRNRCRVLKEVYKVDEAKKTIVCILTFDMQLDKAATDLVYPLVFVSNKENGTLGQAGIYTVLGISKCHPDDTFDVVKGKRIAQSKAKLKMYRKAATVWKSIGESLTISRVDILSRYNVCFRAAIEEKEHIKDLDK